METASDNSRPIPAERQQDPDRGLLAAILSAPQWVVDLVRTSSTRRLVLNDLHRAAPEDQSQNLLMEFKTNYTPMKGVPYTELFCIFRVLAKDIAIVFICGIYLGSVAIIMPLLYRLTLLEIQKPPESLSKGRACFLSLLCSIVLVVARLGNSLWTHATSLMLEKVRSLLILALYDKALRLSPLEYKTYDEPQITVLIMNDVERFIRPWSTILTTSGLSLLLLPEFLFLFDVLKFASLVYPVAIVLFVAAFIGFAAMMADSDSAALRAADFRIGLLRELLKNVHIVKFYGWERPLAMILDAYHRMEQKNLRLSHLLNAINATFSDMLSPICSSLAFVLYVHANNRLSPDRAFPTLFMSIWIFQALSIAPEAYMDTVNAIESIQRIDNFFQAKERSDVLGELPENGRYIYDVRNCKIGWPSKEVVHNMKAKIIRGSLVVVTGPVGSGKSTLLAALQGLSSQTPGAIRISKGARVSSVMKNWAKNGSVRDNILFGNEWDPRKYESVVSMCCLNVDFDALPDGDLTEIGDGGVTLSGGQRTRISLARCLYVDSDVYILDDVLAAVDGQVARKIFSSLRHLATGSKTVVLASNDYKILHSADQVLFLDGKGECHCGSYEKLLKMPSFSDAVESAMSVPGLEADSDDSDAGEDLVPNAPRGLNMRVYRPNIGVTDLCEGEIGMNADIRLKAYDSTISFTSATPSGEERTSALFTLVYQDESPTPRFAAESSGAWRLFQTSSRWTGRLLAFSTLLFASQALLSIFPPMMVANVVSVKTVSSQKELMYLVSAGVFVRTVFLLLSHIIKNFALDSLARGIHKVATLNLFKAPMPYFESMPMGRLMTRFTVDLGVFNTDFRYLVPASVSYGSGLLAFTGLLAWLEPFLGVPFFLYILIRMILWWESAESISRSQQLKNVYGNKVITSIMEKVNGMGVIADHQQQHNAIADLAECLDDSRMCISTVLYMQRFATFRALRQVAPWILVLPIAAIVLKREPGPARLGLMIYALTWVTMLAANFIDVSNQRASCSESCNRLVELISRLPRETYFKSRSREPWEAKHGAVEFVNAYFQYRRQLPFVLNNFNLKIQAGEKLGICGRTGAGKTTIFNALFRFSELRRGQILIDGQDISKLGVKELRNSLAVIPQQTVLFRGTIRSNLDPTQDIEDSVLWDALRRSGFCEATTKQVYLDYQVDAEGSNFSSGERQLIALARALVHRCRLILLDEATAAVDYATDRLIQQTIQREFSSCTILCIAHRIQTIVNYDKILTLGVGGRSIEYGKPKELYNKKGLFWEMCEDAGVEDSDFQ